METPSRLTTCGPVSMIKSPTLYFIGSRHAQQEHQLTMQSRFVAAALHWTNLLWQFLCVEISDSYKERRRLVARRRFAKLRYLLNQPFIVWLTIWLCSAVTRAMLTCSTALATA